MRFVPVFRTHPSKCFFTIGRLFWQQNKVAPISGYRMSTKVSVALCRPWVVAFKREYRAFILCAFGLRLHWASDLRTAGQ